MVSTSLNNPSQPMQNEAAKPATSIHARAVEIGASFNWYGGMLRFIMFGNALEMLCLLYMGIDPNSPLGLLRNVVTDFNISRSKLLTLLVVIFFFDISQVTREIRPVYGTLYALKGQAVLAGLGLIYLFAGKLTLIGFFGIGGTFTLSVIGILVAAQYHNDPQNIQKRFQFKHLMFPALNLFMGLLVLGLVLQPDAVITHFITNAYGAAIFSLTFWAICWGGGQFGQNHFTPWDAFRRLGGIIFFAFMSISLFLADHTAISILTVYTTVSVVVLSMFFTMVHTQDGQHGS